MLKLEAHQLNFSSLLYNKIPKNHILKQINSAISLNFIKNKKKITKINIKIYLSNFFDYNLKISATFSVVSVRPH